MFNNIYLNKKVLITGHTGFKGTWLTLWLEKLGAKIIGISDQPPSKLNFYQNINFNKKNIISYKENILNKESLYKIYQKHRPDFIFHLAAQSLVSESYKYPAQTMQTNAIGTSNILDMIKDEKKKITVIIITSDKVYKNLEWDWGYRENDLLGGVDPYSASKAMAELSINSYINSFFNNKKNINLCIARAGNVIGGGDWAKDRIVPDCIRAWSKNKKVKINNISSTRPWQHVLEPISGYLHLGSVLNLNKKINFESFNFGPKSDQNFNVKELLKEMKKYWPNSEWKTNSKKKLFKESKLLKLNIDKSMIELNWYPVLEFNKTIEMTIKWYIQFYKNSNKCKSFSINQIDEYTELAKEKNTIWSK